MVSKTTVAVMLLGVMPVMGEDGQATDPPPKEHNFLGTFVRDQGRIWTGPFRPKNYDSHTMKKYGLPFLVISAGLLATDWKTAKVLPNTPDQEKWSGRVSQFGASYTLAGFSGMTYVFGKATHNKRAAETGRLAMLAFAHSQVVVLAVKGITQRERPENDDAKSGFWRGGDSFPSGHAAGSFAVASVFAYEYRDHIAVPIAAYSIASLVSASRMAARRHWVSDIFVGGSLGFLMGRYVYKTHHDPNLGGSLPVKRALLTPTIGISGASVRLGWQF